jgi:parvulin-like peptidyl-prolyl isomerase
MGLVHRADLRPEIEAAVFGAQVGEVVGPFKGARGYHLYLVDGRVPAQLDAETQTAIVNELFCDYIERRLGEHAIKYQANEQINES